MKGEFEGGDEEEGAAEMPKGEAGEMAGGVAEAEDDEDGEVEDDDDDDDLGKEAQDSLMADTTAPSTFALRHSGILGLTRGLKSLDPPLQRATTSVLPT